LSSRYRSVGKMDADLVFITNGLPLFFAFIIIAAGQKPEYGYILVILVLLMDIGYLIYHYEYEKKPKRT